jgi:hypothetical protein
MDDLYCKLSLAQAYRTRYLCGGRATGIGQSIRSPSKSCSSTSMGAWDTPTPPAGAGEADFASSPAPRPTHHHQRCRRSFLCHLPSPRLRASAQSGISTRKPHTRRSLEILNPSPSTIHHHQRCRRSFPSSFPPNPVIAFASFKCSENAHTPPELPRTFRPITINGFIDRFSVLNPGTRDEPSGTMVINLVRHLQRPADWHSRYPPTSFIEPKSSRANAILLSPAYLSSCERNGARKLRRSRHETTRGRIGLPATRECADCDWALPVILVWG